MTEYSIIWTPHTSRRGESYYLPLLVDGDSSELLEGGKGARMSEGRLLKGLLVGHQDREHDIIRKRCPMDELLETLEDFVDMSGCEDLESLVLGVSAELRDQYGDGASHLALLTGTEVVPESSKIRFDLCVDLYNIFEREPENKKVLSLFKKHVGLIKADEVDEDFLPILNQLRDFPSSR